MFLPSPPPAQSQVSCVSCLMSPMCQLLSKPCVSLGGFAPSSGRTDAQSTWYKPPLCRQLDQLCPPSFSPAENKPRLNVSVTPHKGVLCLQGALLLRCQAVWSQWQMENPTQRSPDSPWHKSKQVDLMFPLQHILLLMGSQFCDKLHCALGFWCVSAPFPWQ